MSRTFRSSSSANSDQSMSTNLFSPSNESMVSVPHANATARTTQRSKANARKRGPRFTRIDQKSTPLLRRLVGTIFGDYEAPVSAKTIQQQGENNGETLRSLVTLLSQIESKDSSEQARNNNRSDDTSVRCSSHSNETRPRRKR